jgi:hypothetical protein
MMTPVTAPFDAVGEYFRMWNTGDTSAIGAILAPAWVDHAHPEVVGLGAVRDSVERMRAARPELRFTIESRFAGGDGLVAVAGYVGAEPANRLLWLVRLDEGRMAEMWTLREVGR